MHLCFLTREESVCRLIMSRMESFGCQCYLQDDWGALYVELQKFDCSIDMIVSDFSLVGTCNFSLFDSLAEMGKKIPIIYYNDPATNDTERVLHWVGQNELCYHFKFPQEFTPVLENLNSVICDPSIRQHISLLQPAVPVGFEKLKTAAGGRELDLVQFRFRNNLSPVIFRLFEYMYKNRNRELTIKEIEKTLFGKRRAFFGHKSSVYSYISRLRTQIESDFATKVKILRSSKGRYKMIVY